MAEIHKRDLIEASHRLRMVQRDFADNDEPQQKEYLCEELERLLAPVPFGERAEFLRELLERFPARQTQTLGGVGATAGSSGAPQRAAGEPMEWVDALIEGLPSLSEDQKKAVIDRLQEVVAGSQQSEKTPAQPATDIRATLQLASDAAMHQERFGELANLLAEFVVKTEQLTVAVWGKIASKSSIRPPKQTRKLAGKFLSGDDSRPEELVKDLQLLLEFATAIMTAASRAGEEVARRYWRRLSPEAIRSLVDMEQNRLRDSLVSKDVRCWRKYCELILENGAEHIEREIESAMADYAEAFVRGLERLS